MILSKKNLFRFLIFMMLVTTYLPVAANNLPPIVGSFHFWAPLFFIMLILLRPKVYTHKTVMLIVFIGLLFSFVLRYTLWNKLDEWNTEEIWIEMYYFLTGITVYWYFLESKDYYGLAKLSYIAFVFICITSVLTIYSSVVDPFYARKLTGGEFETMQREYFSKLGGGNYSFATALLAIFPVGIYYYRNNQLVRPSKTFIVFILALFMVAIIRMQFVANILMAVIIFIFALAGRRRLKWSLISVSILLTVAIMVPSEVYSQMFRFAGTSFSSNTEMYVKFTDMSQFIVENDLADNTTITGSRAFRYITLWQGFIHSPLLGLAYNKMEFYDGQGAHLYWMNRLTLFGIVGFALLLVIHTHFIRFHLRCFYHTEFLFYFLLSVTAILGMGLMKNLAGRETWLMYFLILPGSYYMPWIKKQRQRTRTKPYISV